MAVLRMSHVGICVADWKRSLAFYHDVLGFRYVSELEIKGEPSETLLRLRDVELRVLYLEREGVRIELLHYASPGHVGDDAPRPMNRLGLTHLSLRVDDLDAFLEVLRRQDVTIHEDTRIDIAQSHSKAIFIADPDGMLIEIVEQPGA